ncbi:DUF547 domain-containing protein [Hanstruepera ponticola]|uniref:DUF547 domain-containing protein n=1 Tax=Hanstruepera ponticola TaxID=2042995 RepID=UPI001F3CDFFC|nr:DUF547 domain-containing protein [Hanstruepera ponticola]
MKKVLILITIIIATHQLSMAQQVDHTIWSTFLQNHVSKDGHVHYKNIKVNNAELTNYLNQFVEISPSKTWKKNEILAYWINAYNAFTVKLIIDNYPVQSIKDIKDPWDQKFIPINGELISLNDIEHEILRKMDEPRIHFAIVCASESCPKLQNKAFVADKLEQQLTNATKEFLDDNTKNRITKNELELSKIFKWFSKDFKQKGSLIDFLNQYSEVQISEDAKINYLDYSWELND